MPDGGQGAADAGGASGRPRDARGRFVNARGTVRGRRGKGRIGIRGSTDYADMSYLKLARTAAWKEIELGRLKAELDGVAWTAPERPVRVNMAGIAASQKASVDAKASVLAAVLKDLATERAARRPSVIARMMRERLGRFDESQLYRKPLDTLWREPADFLGKNLPIDGTPQMAKCARMNRRALVGHIVRLKDQIEKAGKRRSDQLIAIACGNEGEDWSPIVLS